jgi:hypothetical protein
VQVVKHDSMLSAKSLDLEEWRLLIMQFYANTVMSILSVDC